MTNQTQRLTPRVQVPEFLKIDREAELREEIVIVRDVETGEQREWIVRGEAMPYYTAQPGESATIRMSRALDVVTLTGEEYDDLMECKEMVTSLLAQLSAAKDRIAELTPVAGMDWRETMQRMLTRMEETDRWPAICDEARAVLSLANDATREPAAYLWGGCLWRTDEMGRGRPGAVELYRAQTPLTDADITALLPIWQQGSWTLPDYGRWVARAVERAHGIKTSHNLCLSCGHSIDAHDRQYGCAEDGCDCETPNTRINRPANAVPVE